MGFNEGYKTGTVTGNPIEGLLDAVNKKFQERNIRRQKDAEEEKSLTNELVKLTAIENVKSKYKQQEQLTEGISKGTIQETTDIGKGTFEGTPFGEVGKRYKAINTKNAADPTGLSNEQQTQARALSRKINGVRGAEYGLPAIYEELRKGKEVAEILLRNVTSSANSA